MRTIKYRGRDGHGCWHIGWLVETNDGTIYIVENDEGWTDDGFHNDDFSGWYKVLEKTVGQFTGLFDKNGKEIYEGDIVRFYSYDRRCITPDCDAFNLMYENYIKKVEDVVSYEDGMFSCDGTPLAWCGYFDLDELRFTLYVSEEDGWQDADGNIIDEHILGIEIIGNIHDNSEQLIKD